ncbi:MAG: glucose-6-phosphate isomerase [Arenicella sp.]|nr:glucose-6-phosphate isomerase [Arenicella sp.]
MSTPSISTAIRNSLEILAISDKSTGIKAKFGDDLNRVDRYSLDFGQFYMDMSKTHISQELISIYMEFADEIDFVGKREALLAGERVNNSENRSVLHTLLRDTENQGISMSDDDVLAQAKASKAQFVDQYHQIQGQLSKREHSIKDIIHVGIGGSSLGTQLVFEALKDLNSSIKVHFIGNIDAHQLVDVLSQCELASTLVIGVSKTFTTAETLQNLDSIASWFKTGGVSNPLAHFFGVTAAPSKAHDYGIPANNVVSFPNWVGGRYSVWSSVSLSAALVIGIEKFEEFLSGAAALDKHFYTQNLESNGCFLAAMLDHYYVNFLDVKSRAIFAYDYRLRSLVDYLQQLETESNGKDRQRDGGPVDQQTSPVVWGGVGTDVQHSVFQMLHQGTSLIPSEFILVRDPDHKLIDHHQELLANGLAQTAALLEGQDKAQIDNIHAQDGLTDLAKKAKIFTGERPSTTILLDRLTPKTLGALLAFYEHRTFCFGVFANINSYDQMGVELGKRLATQVKPLLESGQAQKSAEVFDPSTLSLLNKVRNS